MKYIVLGIVLIASLNVQAQNPSPAAATDARQSPDASLALKEQDLDKLSLKLKDLRILQQQYQIASTQLNDLNSLFNTKQAEFDQAFLQMKKEHKWGDDIVFDKVNGVVTKLPPPQKVAPKK